MPVIRHISIEMAITAAQNLCCLNMVCSPFPRVYLKTLNVTGSEEFSHCARHFFAGILTYFKKK